MVGIQGLIMTAPAKKVEVEISRDQLLILGELDL
jgi:hypothetical protein